MAARRTLIYLTCASVLVVAVAALLWIAFSDDGGNGGAGSRAEPLEIGASADLGNGWSAKVNSANLSADDEVAAAEEFNEPAQPGMRYVVVNLSASNTGGGTEAPAIEISLFGSSGAEYDGRNLVTPPEPRFDTVTELEAGESTTGNLVFVVDTEEAGLQLRLQPRFAVEGSQTWVDIGS